MPRRRLLAATLCLGLLTGIQQLWNSSKRVVVDTSGSPPAAPSAIEHPESARTRIAVGLRHRGAGASTPSDEPDPGDPKDPRSLDPGMSLAAMADALRSAPDAGQKGEWADRIAAMGGREAVENLVSLAIGEQDETSLRAILEAFKGISNPQDILLLASVVTATSDFRVLEAATEMISRSATPEVVDYLAELSRQDPLQPTQRFAALWTIERIENPEAIRGLAKLVQQAPEPDLTQAATVALARLGGPLAESVLAESTQGRHRNDPDFQQLVENVITLRSGDFEAGTSPVSWAVPQEGAHP